MENTEEDSDNQEEHSKDERRHEQVVQQNAQPGDDADANLEGGRQEEEDAPDTDVVEGLEQYVEPHELYKEGDGETNDAHDN